MTNRIIIFQAEKLGGKQRGCKEPHDDEGGKGQQLNISPACSFAHHTPQIIQYEANGFGASGSGFNETAKHLREVRE